MKSIRRRILIGLLGVVILFGVAPLSGAGAADDSDKQAKRIKTPRERLAERSFPNITLTTHEGKKVRFYDDLLKDKIVLINFMYVKRNGTCPGTTANLLQARWLAFLLSARGRAGCFA
jgi:cytochrome oxidase Cu insertion factor (SCO1/SenC/PrrC family)